MLFKVIQGHRNRYQSKARMRLPIAINSNNWHPTSYRFGDIAVAAYNHSLLFKFWTLCVFEPPFGGLGTMYDVHLGLIGKHTVDCLLGLIKGFSLCYSWGATGENRSKIGDFAPTRSVSGRRGRPPPIIFALIVRKMNALQLCCWQFSHKETL